MWEQTKIEDFVEIKKVKRKRKKKKIAPKSKSFEEQILERLERIEEMIQSGNVSASVTITKPALAGGPPIRSIQVPTEKRIQPSALASELKELMGIEEGENYLGTPKEILAALRARK